MKLYGFPLSPFVRKVLVALSEKGLEAELVPTNPQQPDAAFLACSPFRKIPALEDAAREADTALEANLAVIPNLPAPDVPEGDDEHGNVEVKTWGSPREGSFAEHADFVDRAL